MAQGVVDTIMVGRLGPASIGAVALGNAVCYTPSLFGIGILLGLDTLVSQAHGRKDYDECHRWLAQGVYLALIVTPPVMVSVWLASFGYSRFGIAPEVAAPAATYLRILNWGTLPLLIYGGTRRYLQGVGQVRVVTLTFVVLPTCSTGLATGCSSTAIGARPAWVSTVGSFHRRRPPLHGLVPARICLAL